MPVLRQRERVNVQVGGGGVLRAPSGEAMQETGRIVNQMTTRLARTYGQTLAAASETEAVAMAKKAALTTGPNGAPQMPKEALGKLSIIAQQSFDRTIEGRYTDSLAVAIRNQVNQAQIANPLDYDAFQADVEARLTAMRGDVPDAFTGAFDQIANSEMTGASAQIGWREANAQIQSDREQEPVRNRETVNRIRDAILTGDEELAQQLFNTRFEDIDNLPVTLAGAQVRQDMKDELVLGTALARMENDYPGGFSAMTPDQLTDLASRLIAGDDSDILWNYFREPGSETPAYHLGAAAASHVRQFLGEANARATATRDEAEKQVAIQSLRNGTGDPNSKTHRAAMDTMLRSDLSLPPGTKITPQTWLDLAATQEGMEKLKSGIATMKSGGVLSASIIDLFTSLDRNPDPELLAAAYPIWKLLKDGPNLQQTDVRDFTESIPKDVQKRMLIAEAAYGGGGEFDEPLVDAFVKIDTALLQEDFDDKALARTMNAWIKQADNPGFIADALNSMVPSAHMLSQTSQLVKRWNSGPPVTDENAEDRLRELVGATVFDGMEVSTKQFNDAVEIVKLGLQMNQSLESTLQTTRTTMEKRVPETKYFGRGIVRSSYAPERFYQDMPALTGRQVVENFLGGAKNATKGGSLSIIEDIAEMPAHVIEFATGVDLFDANFGADYTRASTFDKIAHTRIREALENNPQFMNDPWYNKLIETRTFLKPGVDYSLTPLKTYGNADPVYAVTMYDDSGRPAPIPGFVLNVRPEWQQMRAIYNEHATLLAQIAGDWERLKNMDIEEYRKALHETWAMKDSEIGAYLKESLK